MASYDYDLFTIGAGSGGVRLKHLTRVERIVRGYHPTTVWCAMASQGLSDTVRVLVRWRHRHYKKVVQITEVIQRIQDHPTPPRIGEQRHYAIALSRHDKTLDQGFFVF